MLVSTKGRYALRVIIDLAEREGEGYLPLRDIAHRLGISEKYLESVLKTLVRDHLIEGMRGKGSGYRLTRPAADCTAGEVLRVTEGSLAPVDYLDELSGEASPGESCYEIFVWKGLHDLVKGYLGGISLQDVVDRSSQLAIDSYTI